MLHNKSTQTNHDVYVCVVSLSSFWKGFIKLSKQYRFFVNNIVVMDIDIQLQHNSQLFFFTLSWNELRAFNFFVDT